MKMMNNFKIIVFFLFSCLFSFEIPAQTKNISVANCSDKQAEVFFKDKNIVINYNKSYYCSDILYLLKTKKGNISLSDYTKLYPTDLHSNFNYLRKLGFTPDVIEKYIKKDIYKIFQDRQSIDNYIKTAINFTRKDYNYDVIVDEKYEPHLKDTKDNIFEKGDILNKEKYYKNCLIKTEKDTENIISYFPVAMSPVVINGDALLNMFGEKIAVVKNNPFDLKQKTIFFQNDFVNNDLSFDIYWNNEVCELKNTLQKRVDRLSRCIVCSAIVMFSNLISYLFQAMYDNFRNIIIAFWIVFGSLWILFEFLKNFKGLPFDVDLKSFPKSISKKMQILFTISILILVPVPKLFSWTVAPVLDLTLGISHMIMNISAEKQENKFYCDINKSVKDVMISFQNENPLPPIITKNQNATIKITSITDNEKMIFSNDTMGSIVCFLKNILTHNAKYVVMGETLMIDSWYSVFTPNSFRKMFIGLMIFGLFIMINLRISFYILDALFDFLKLAITWPFAVFGMVFNIIGFSTSINNLIGMAKKFGLIMVNLSVFSLYNAILINSFSFTNAKDGDNIANVLNNAIATGDTKLITENIFTDILSVSKFLFIVYCLYYIYSKLGQFASFYGGNSGDLKIEKSMEQIVKNTTKTVITPPKRDEKKEKLKKMETKK